MDPDSSKWSRYDDNDDDGQYRISFTGHETVTGNFDGYAIAGILESAAKAVPGGYLVEASIRLPTISPRVGTFLGFDVQLTRRTGRRGSGAKDRRHRGAEVVRIANVQISSCP